MSELNEEVRATAGIFLGDPLLDGFEVIKEDSYEVFGIAR